MRICVSYARDEIEYVRRTRRLHRLKPRKQGIKKRRAVLLCIKPKTHNVYYLKTDFFYQNLENAGRCYVIRGTNGSRLCVDDNGRRHAGRSVMNLFQYADYTSLQRDLKTAQARCQTRRINHIHTELKAVVTDILRATKLARLFLSQTKWVIPTPPI
jgi:hypothetical protein